jgi:hypothetical protein
MVADGAVAVVDSDLMVLTSDVDLLPLPLPLWFFGLLCLCC